MVSTKHMLLFISSAGIRRAAVSNGPSYASAFLARAPLTRPSSSAAAAAIAQSWSAQTRQVSIARFMSTDAAPAEKTEEEKAALKAERAARK